MFGSHSCVCATYFQFLKCFLKNSHTLRVQQWNQCYTYFLEHSMDEKSEPSSTNAHFQNTHKLNAQDSQGKLLSRMLWSWSYVFLVFGKCHMVRIVLASDSSCFLSEDLNQRKKKENELFYFRKRKREMCIIVFEC